MTPPNRGPMRGARIPGAKLDGKTAKRLLSYLGGRHKAALGVVLVCILFSALAGVAGSLFLRILIDDYITPLLAMEKDVYKRQPLGSVSVAIAVY